MTEIGRELGLSLNAYLFQNGFIVDGGPDVVLPCRPVGKEARGARINCRIRSEYQLFVAPKWPESKQQKIDLLRLGHSSKIRANACWSRKARCLDVYVIIHLLGSIGKNK